MPYPGIERREAGALLHVCTQEDNIRNLVEWQSRQNGSLQRMETVVSDLHSLIADRLPQDLPQRLRALEKEENRRGGALGLSKWMVGVFGVGSLAAMANFLLRDGGWLYSLSRIFHMFGG